MPLDVCCWTPKPEALAVLAELKAERFVDIATAAAYLNLPVGWLYKNLRLLPHYRIGRYVRFRLSELDGWTLKTAVQRRSRG